MVGSSSTGWADYPSPEDSTTNSPKTPSSSPPPDRSPYPRLCSPSGSSSSEHEWVEILIMPPLSGPLPALNPLQRHCADLLSSLLGSLATALSSLPPLVPEVPSAPCRYDEFAELAAQPARRSFRHLHHVLSDVWGVPGGVRAGHITRGEKGTKLVMTLFERVGVDALSRLDSDEREEAIAWTRALRDAAIERSKCAEFDESQPLFEDDSPVPGNGSTIAPAQAWDPSTFGSIGHSKRYSSISYAHHFGLPPSCLSEDEDDLMSELSYASSASTSASGYNRPPTNSSAPTHLHSTPSLSNPPPPKRLKLSHASLKYSQPAPRVEKLVSAASLPRSSSAPNLGASGGPKLNPPTARVAAKNANTKVTQLQQPKSAFSTPTRPSPIQRPATVPRPAPPPPAPLAPIVAPRASLCGRPQRDRKMPTWLNESVELHAASPVQTPPVGGLTTPAATPKSTPPAPQTVAPPLPSTAPRDRERRRERRSADDETDIAQDESRFKPGQVVLARMPWSWWPTVVLDPKAKEQLEQPTAGMWTPDSYLVKSIPTGGDWRWLPPDLVQEFPAGLADALLRDRLPEDSKFKSKAWREWRVDAKEAARIINDPKRLKSWMARKTSVEVQMERDKK